MYQYATEEFEALEKEAPIQQRKLNLKTGLSEYGVESIESYVTEAYITEELIKIVMERSEPVDTIYRGLSYLESDLKIGHIYQSHDDLLSWSKDRKVATKFAMNEFVADWAIDKLYQRLIRTENSIPVKDTQELSNYFVQVLLFDDSGKGFDINKHYYNFVYGDEEEFVTAYGRWMFTSIEKRTDGEKIYYEVGVKRVD